MSTEEKIKNFVAEMEQEGTVILLAVHTKDKKNFSVLPPSVNWFGFLKNRLIDSAVETYHLDNQVEVSD